MPSTNKIIVAVVAVIAVVIVLAMIILPYNGLVSKDQDVQKSWSNIQVEIQRQMDLIPSVMAQVNTSMGFEQSLLTNITQLRTQWLNTLANGTLDDTVDLSQQFSVEMGSFLSVAENNPEIQSIQVIRDLITELEGTQNRIAAHRIFYNDAVRDYNAAVRSFPNNLVAGMFGFEEARYYQQGL